ncbi:rRNA maturation RNase YbeY [Carboxydothermus ferrireducens]|uniref:Endoribonuclease YbeY n=1 Tax=Carboxydothermus ferrireducens DSM 11255 TaxID=1119529 RepID=A0ABX2R8Y4_9THEO|nr:rRNA maturation RNase YbeY [Carboxydothermus ferrireducens]NYE56320.1 putative rRNA maturation factor [Carboxydothermus ferrireducens DSM 11255]
MTEITNLQDKVDVDETLLNIITQAVSLTLNEEGRVGVVSIALVDNIYIQSLNREYRQKDVPTDVLSFPLADDEDDEVLGDVVISLEKAAEQAKEYGHSFFREVAFLTVHGVLHLLGHDHYEEEETRIMREKEEKILSALGLER